MHAFRAIRSRRTAVALHRSELAAMSVDDTRTGARQAHAEFNVSYEISAVPSARLAAAIINVYCMPVVAQRMSDASAARRSWKSRLLL